jgi:putative ABC transport system permease protein
MHSVPKVAERILRRLVPGREGETIAGDLREEFDTRGGGRAWYWFQVLSCLAVRMSPHRLAVPDLGRDFHFAFRMLRRNPGYAFTAMLCLALGIGVNATVYTLVDELFFKKLPVPNAGRVVMLERAGEETTCSYRDYQDLMRRTDGGGRRIFSGLAAFDDLATSLDTEGVSQMVMAQTVTANFASTLGLRAQIGRWFVPEDEAQGSEPVAVLSDSAWARRFGRRVDAIGQRVRIETQWYRVIGVAPADFLGVSPPHSAEVWVPLPSQPYVRQWLLLPAERERPKVRLIGRLAAGVRLRSAEAEVRTIDAQIWREFPRDKPEAGLLSLAVASGVGASAARPVAFHLAALLLIVTAVVLMIACVNVANLLLSRSVVRRREMAVRQALGASRWRLAQQMLAESLTLAAGGTALGLLFALWTNRLLVRTMPAIPHLGFVTFEMSLNWRVVALAVAAASSSAILFSLSPAIEQSQPDLTPALKSEGGGLRRMRQRDVYVVAQVALSLVLLIAATLLVRALRRAGETDPGFAMDHRLAVRIYISEPEYTPETGKLFFARVLDQLRATPGVRAATLSYTIPLNFGDSACVVADRAEKPRRAGSNQVVPGYFDVMGIPLVAGRDFRAADQPGSPRVVIVNQTLARRYWPNDTAVGKTVWLGCDPKRPRTMAEVVGVARDAKYGSLDEASRSFVYSAFAQGWVGFMAVTVHTAGDPAEFGGPLRGVLQGLDPHLRIYEMSTLEAMTAQSLWQVRWQAWLLGSLGMLAILLAAVGLYGVVAYTVAQRTREIGVRMAMGAQRADVLWMVLGRGLRLTAIGVGIGIVLSALVTRFLGGFLYGLSPLDAVSFAAAALFWIATAMVASYLPARRAARVDPVVALRWE